MSHAAQTGDPRIGKVIDGRYEVIERVGEGGMGVVYKARQVSIDRLIAIKMLNKQMASDPNWVERFYNEARACSRLQHPNTIRMFDFGQTREGALFMTMEFLDGHSLRHAIAAGAPMDPARVLKILIQICASLSEAHSLKIIHRDMKPDNVFLLNLAGSPDFVKVLDFSVAKLMQAGRLKTQAGVVFGTPQYMSPEQGRGVPLDPRSDLYGLGVLSYEMLTGQVPFDDHNPMTVLQMHLTNPLPPLPGSVPQAMQAVTNRALAKDPNQRFQSAQEMLQACQQAFAQLGAQAAGMQRAGGPPPAAPPLGGPVGAKPAAGVFGGARAGAAAKTMMANTAGLGDLSSPGFGPPGDASQPGLGPPGGSSNPGVAAPSSAKTIMADGLDSLAGLPPQGPSSTPNLPPPMSGGSPLPAGAGPKKTMMLHDSSGVISYTQSGSGPVERPGSYGAHSHAGQVESGPSVLFWAISLTAGIVIGVLAYLLLLGIRG
ncbi:MAG: serine/threonine protein kinase [Deltaproteobacteria bacterium]|nr:serine/threonine protein kinase [Deltaproteobacteria bacterium]